MLVHTNLTLSGSVAQYGRGVGIIQATAAQIMNQFAKCLRDKFGQQRVAAPPLVPDGVTPVAAAAYAAAAESLAPTARRASRPDLGLRADGARDLERDHRPVPAVVTACLVLWLTSSS